MRGELDGKGQLSATFSNVLSSQKRRVAFEGRMDMDKGDLRQHLKQILDTEIDGIKSERAEALAGQRKAFLDGREELISQQDIEREKVREAWRQIYATRGQVSKFGRSTAEGSEPVKKDFDSRSKSDAPKPKKQPTKTATVSKPSPAPSPSGEVPRTVSTSQQVPTKSWGKKSTPQPTRGLSGTEPAKKSWGKTGASAAAIDKPKDWGKKVERSSVKKAPTPRRDLDRSR